MSIGKLSAAHAFNYIVLRVKSGLTSCEDLATALLEPGNRMAADKRMFPAG